MQCRKIKLSKSWERKKLAKLRTYLAGDRSMRSKKPLLQDTVKLAEGCDAVCTFVNDFAGGMNGPFTVPQPRMEAIASRLEAIALTMSVMLHFTGADVVEALHQVGFLYKTLRHVQV